jgi:hypothetical protein
LASPAHKVGTIAPPPSPTLMSISPKSLFLQNSVTTTARVNGSGAKFGNALEN